MKYLIDIINTDNQVNIIDNNMKQYNLIHKTTGMVINKKPLTLEQAENECSLIVMNHGYKPIIVELK